MIVELAALTLLETNCAPLLSRSVSDYCSGFQVVETWPGFGGARGVYSMTGSSMELTRATANAWRGKHERRSYVFLHQPE